jgi:hypothetical protein
VFLSASEIQPDALKAYSANAESLQANDVDAAEMSGVKKPCATSLRADITAVKGTVGQLYSFWMPFGADKMALETK